MAKTRAPSAALQRLLAYYCRNGYARLSDWHEAAPELGNSRKGDELRFVARSQAELTEIQELLRSAGFKPGKPFAKGKQWRQPVYGRESVARFLALVHYRAAANDAAARQT